MTPYKELLGDVRRIFREVRKEYKLVKKEKKGSKLILQKYEVEAKKLQRITGSKRKFSLANIAKTTENLQTILEELEDFLSAPAIRKKDRVQRRELQLKKLKHDWNLSEEESWRFFDIINSEEVKAIMERANVPSEVILELATSPVKAKKAVLNIANMTQDDINKLSTMSNYDKVEFLTEVIKRRR